MSTFKNRNEKKGLSIYRGTSAKFLASNRTIGNQVIRRNLNEKGVKSFTKTRYFPLEEKEDLVVSSKRELINNRDELHQFLEEYDNKDKSNQMKDKSHEKSD